MQVFNDREEYERWIEGEDWYQTIELKNGLRTPGKFPTHLRTSIFEKAKYENRSVLDVGCNSGQYCLMAKARGAKEVVGIDISQKRIEQARVLAANEGFSVEYHQKGVFDLESFERRFDIVFCVAVLTEITDVFGAIRELKSVIGERAFIELDLAKPVLYASLSKRWLKGYEGLSRRTAVAEVRRIKNGEWVVSPSFDVLCAAFGDEFELSQRRGGIRYDLVEVERKT